MDHNDQDIKYISWKYWKWMNIVFWIKIFLSCVQLIFNLWNVRHLKLNNLEFSESCLISLFWYMSRSIYIKCLKFNSNPVSIVVYGWGLLVEETWITMNQITQALKYNLKWMKHVQLFLLVISQIIISFFCI